MPNPRYPSASVSLFTVFLAATPARAEAEEPAEEPTQLDPESVAKHIASHEDEVEQCRARALESTPDASQPVTIQFRVDDSGTVIDAVADGEDPTEGSLFEACILRAIRGWPMPPATAGVDRGSFTFEFAAAAQTDTGNRGVWLHGEDPVADDPGFPRPPRKGQSLRRQRTRRPGLGFKIAGYATFVPAYLFGAVGG